MLRRGKDRTYTLRRAAAVVFMLISILPLLLFTYTLYALDMPRRQVAQIGLGSALLLSMIGFYIYSAMISRIAVILRDLETEESAPPLAGATQVPVVTMAIEPGPDAPAAESQAAGATRPKGASFARRLSPFAAKERPGPGGRGGLVVPGMGRITELKAAAPSAPSELDSMWRAEVEPLLGQRVLVAVRKVPDPMKGILAQVTQNGLILDQRGNNVGISYTRLSAIEADTSPEPA